MDQKCIFIAIYPVFMMHINFSKNWWEIGAEFVCNMYCIANQFDPDWWHLLESEFNDDYYAKRNFEFEAEPNEIWPH